MNKNGIRMNWLKLLTLFVIAGAATSASAVPQCEKPWVFFDLGQTIIDTDTHNYDPMFYLESVRNFEDGKRYQSAADYLRDLSARGYRVGLLVDIPQEWGSNYPVDDRATAQVLSLMDFTEGKMEGETSSWTGARMDWSPFGKMTGEGSARKFEGLIFLPRNNSERKKVSPVLFQRAVEAASAAGCKAIYQGEATSEMDTAEKAGMAPFQVGKTSKRFFYLPIRKLKGYADQYRPGDWSKPQLKSRGE